MSSLSSLVKTVLVVFGPIASLGTATTALAEAKKDIRIATFAGGCFWCVESDFDHVPGVVKTISGYTGGKTKNPSYRDVTSGGSGHYEAVQIYFDPMKTTYAKLLDVFWRSVDPTDGGGQFCDRGMSYQTAIFANTPEQKELALASKTALEKAKILKDPIVTPVLDSASFYPAEGYHQNYYKNNSYRYKFYRLSCGRDARIKKLWGDQAHRGITPH